LKATGITLRTGGSRLPHWLLGRASYCVRGVVLAVDAGGTCDGACPAADHVGGRAIGGPAVEVRWPVAGSPIPPQI